jgi:hypothetical protein
VLHAARAALTGAAGLVAGRTLADARAHLSSAARAQPPSEFLVCSGGLMSRGQNVIVQPNKDQVVPKSGRTVYGNASLIFLVSCANVLSRSMHLSPSF